MRTSRLCCPGMPSPIEQHQFFRIIVINVIGEQCIILREYRIKQREFFVGGINIQR